MSRTESLEPKMTTTTRVITWQSPAGATTNVTPAQEAKLKALGSWPRDHQGQEFCDVSRGLHNGTPSDDVDELIAELEAQP